jgi:hypothetical protein
VRRFIDDMSILAIEDCLISKLSMLFRSSNVLKMGDEEIARLAGETLESALERRRLEAKRGILETGLQGLKSLHRRRNTVSPNNADQVASEDSQQLSVMTPSRSEKASIPPDSGEAPRAMNPDEASPSPAMVATPPPIDGWLTRTGLQSDMEDIWAPRPKKGKKKASGHGTVYPLADQEWGH